MSPRALRRDLLAFAPDTIGPGDIVEVPVLLLDGTGVRAGTQKLGVSLHLAVGLVARRKHEGRTVVEARLLAATVDEPRPVLAGLLAQERPGLIVVDGEPELVDLAHATFPDVPVQRCLWHLAGLTKTARYTDRALASLVTQWRDELERVLLAAYRADTDDAAAAARAAHHDLVEDIDACGGHATATQLRNATDDALCFLANPDAGRLVFGHRHRPELGTGVLDRVMREMNRRTDVGVRWSIPGVRGLLMVKLARKYRTGPCTPVDGPPAPNPVRFRLAAH